jgi:hypothetical protein
VEPYGLNIGRFIREHPEWVIQAGPYGSGYSARRKDGAGRPAGQRLTALTIDDLAAQMAAPESTETA